LTRGDIFTAATGHGFGRKPRPVLVLQADEYRDTGLLLTVGITGDLTASPTLRTRLQPTPGNGLRKVSDVMVDLILPVREDKFGRRIGTIDAADMTRVENALLIILGFRS